MFKDREDAAVLLARKLAQFKNKDAVVYALPRGGVALGKIISQELGLPLDLIIARKIGHPNNSEYAIAAVCENSVLVTEKSEVGKVDKGWFEREVKRQREEAKRRRRVYLGNKKSIQATGKSAIIVDDGAATGLTLRAAIEEIKLQEPGKIIVALPVAPREIKDELEKIADQVVVLEIPKIFSGAVGSYYDSFSQVTDGEVIELLKGGED